MRRCFLKILRLQFPVTATKWRSAFPCFLFALSGIGENFYSVDLRLMKGFYLRGGSEGPRLDFVVEVANLFNRVNYVRVNDIVCGTATQPGFINGCDPKFWIGPFDFKGVGGLPPTEPLGFVAAARPRQFQLGLLGAVL